MALIFEGGMVVLAVAINEWLSLPPFSDLKWTFHDAALGALLAIPLLGLFHAVLSLPWPPFERISRALDDALWPMMRNAGVGELLFTSAIAGLGEELLFRGVVQGLLSARLGTPAGIGIASLVFGLCHPITPTYIVGASLIGAGFGALWLKTGSLLCPVVCHATYDFLALLLLRREKRKQEAEWQKSLYGARTQNVQADDNIPPEVG